MKPHQHNQAPQDVSSLFKSQVHFFHRHLSWSGWNLAVALCVLHDFIFVPLETWHRAVATQLTQLLGSLFLGGPSAGFLWSPCFEHRETTISGKFERGMRLAKTTWRDLVLYILPFPFSKEVQGNTGKVSPSTFTSAYLPGSFQSSA